MFVPEPATSYFPVAGSYEQVPACFTAPISVSASNGPNVWREYAVLMSGLANPRTMTDFREIHLTTFPVDFESL